jgi:5'-deoxynucleotidase YfbR-like HD superfamily hydrolase
MRRIGGWKAQEEEKLMPPRVAPAPRAFQRMLSGRRLDLLDPSPLDIEIEDIAHGLARVARWNGQTSGPHIFSVAQHSILVEHIAGAIDPGIPARWRLMLLLHDAPEYVIGDMISPFKAVIGDNYKAVEERLLGAIHLRFSLPAHTPAALKKLSKDADRASAFIEATRIAGFTVAEAEQFFGRPKISLRNIDAFMKPMESGHAESLFLQRFAEIEQAMQQPGK